MRIIFHRVERSEPLQIEIALLLFGRVAFVAKLCEQRLDFLFKIRRFARCARERQSQESGWQRQQT